MATSAVHDPNDASVWQDGRADPLAWRWHGPALGIAIAMALATAIVSLSDGLAVRDTDKMLSGRIMLLFGTLAFFIVADLVPRAIKRPGPIHVTLPAVARERWNRRRLGAVCLGLLSFYVTYLSYRNLKGFLPFLTDQDYDAALLSLDRNLFFGHDPGPLLHDLLGTGIAAHLLSTRLPVLPRLRADLARRRADRLVEPDPRALVRHRARPQLDARRRLLPRAPGARADLRRPRPLHDAARDGHRGAAAGADLRAPRGARRARRPRASPRSRRCTSPSSSRRR